jgi:hypothetical protein
MEYMHSIEHEGREINVGVMAELAAWSSAEAWDLEVR